MSNIQKFQQNKEELDYFRVLANVASKSGCHNLSPESLMNIMLTAKDLGISPMKAINGGFYIVNGKISMSTALMADRIRKEGHSIKIPEWTDEKCIILGVRRDNGDSIKFEFNIKDAERAGLTHAGLPRSAAWHKFPKQMLYNRAMATLARVLFPDVVGNSYSEDEKYDILDIPTGKRPIEDDHAHTMIAKISADSIEKMNPTMENLEKMMRDSGCDTEHLEDYLMYLAEKKKQTVEQIITSALLPQLLPRFKESYLKEMSKKKEEIVINQEVSA